MEEFQVFLLVCLGLFMVIQLRGIKHALKQLPILEDRILDVQREVNQLMRPKPVVTTPVEEPATTPVVPVPEPAVPREVVPPALPLPPPVPKGQIPLAPSPVPPSPPSKFAQTVGDILGRLGQWLLVGEEFRPRGVTLEYAVATTWLARIGVVVLVTCVGFFLKWSIERDLLGPTARVAVSVLFGLGMLAGGIRLLGRKWNILGQVFTGGGLAILYFSMYALGPLYHLLDSILLVFGLMILVTLTAGVLALAADSMLIAIFGMVGGFCTPILLSTGQANFIGLYSYLILLNLGILGLSHARQWRLLNYLGFLFTFILYAGSLKLYKTSDFPVALTFLSLFFIIQSTLVFLYNLRQGISATVLEIIHLVLNAALFALAAYSLIIDAVGRPYPAILTLVLAFYFILHVALFIQRRLGDRALLMALISLAGFFTTMTMPLAMEKESLSIAWALQAYLFLRLGYGMSSPFLKHLGYALYAVTLVRLVGYELPRFDAIPAPATAPMAIYWNAMSSRLWTFGVAILSVVGAFRLEKKAPAPSVPNLSALNDGVVLPDALTRPVFFWATALGIFIYLQCEFHAMFGWFPAWRPAVLTALWGGMAVFFLARYLASASAINLGALVFFTAGAIGKTLFIDCPGWHVTDSGYFPVDYTLFVALARWLDFVLVLVLLGVGALVLNRRSTPRAVPALFGYAALILFWIYLTLELNTLLHWKLPIFQAGGISVLWTVFAFGLLAGGIGKAVAPLRHAGLLLFAVVVAKVFLSDLAGMPVIYRIIALLALGVLLLLGAFVYLRASERFTKETP